jgi:hypothetical protein
VDAIGQNGDFFYVSDFTFYWYWEVLCLWPKKIINYRWQMKSLGTGLRKERSKTMQFQWIITYSILCFYR